MSYSPHSSPSQADAVADNVMRRRLINALLAVIAGWMLFFALGGPGLVTVTAWASLFVASGVSGGAMGFALWALLVGDQRAWKHAFEQALHAAGGTDKQIPD